MSGQPEGFHTITPYIAVDGASRAIDVYRRGLGAEELMRMPEPGTGRIVHACLQIGSSKLFLCDEIPEQGMVAPKEGVGGSHFYLYCDDVDAQHRTGLAAGMIEVSAPMDMFWGDRTAVLRDPFGHVWTLATHVRDVSEEEMAAAMKEWSG